ncbi:hypothetical protein [Yinghuangia soli]|uniref:HK97 gp10 family phage protein n=1 Tax=Yinghuangia soli TaxID=2908204 RepID=A0AA41Q2T3_9ACTN|nr:hypothetical protein [Yinghuangia soli]MCF2529374.1 hypothetical protein [Yinghuangia soli]
MAGTTLYTVDGMREVRRALRRAGGRELLSELRDEHKWLAEFVKNNAAHLVPRRTGRLAATMRASGTNTMATVRAGGARARYAGPVHWGWPGRPNRAKGWRGGPIRANPWIALAAQRTEPEWAEHYNQALTRLMERISNGD